VQKDAFVNIIQHSAGQAMAVRLSFDQVVDVDDQRIYYLANTVEGSSGAPVFDDRWRLVALHHASGKIDATDKAPIAANIGIPINPIIRAIRAQMPGLLSDE
jgi:endonuclease G